MKPSARLYNCVRCHCQVIICRHCDRGNIYCAKGCADSARADSLRRAGQKYQAGRAGRLANANRQRRFRTRQHQKVTHQGSPVPRRYDVLPIQGRQRGCLVRKHRPVGDHTDMRCHFCHQLCDVFLRIDFLRSPKRHRWRD